jgi:predicted neuraminidase
MRVFTRGSLSALAFLLLAASAPAQEMKGELLFPFEDWHNHGSCIVEYPNGDLLVSWFHGSGERTADDVLIRGARWSKATGQWSEPFVLADVPEFPDTNCCMVIDQHQRLWLLWPTILANTWESALMKYKVSSNYMAVEGPPVWDSQEVLHIKQGDDFPAKVSAKVDEYLASMSMPASIEPAPAVDAPAGAETPAEKPLSPLQALVNMWKKRVNEQAEDKLTRRLGWFTRAHPYILPDGRMLVGLYSDGFSFCLVAITDDLGKSWQFSDPIVGGGNIQPSFALKKDGGILCYMRDNGPPPQRVMVSESADRGMTWSTVSDHPTLPNPGAGLEVANLSGGEMMCIYNDLEDGRHSLAVSISDDDGQTWKWTRHLDVADPDTASFHYPSIIEGRDGTLHASYSYFNEVERNGEPKGKSIKHAAFTREWVKAGDQ